MSMEKMKIIRYIYLYLVTAIAIVMLIIASVNVIKIGLERVFNVKGWDEFRTDYPECGIYTDIYAPKTVPATGSNEQVLSPEEQQKCKENVDSVRNAQRINDIKRELVWSLAMFLVALPLYLYHWRIIRKENNAV